ncbi:MAG: segregation and condensation protein A [Gammaproteobacteria bacterium]|nr:segregation and condensation protein A [Gammaproteobacteria bacterium]
MSTEFHSKEHQILTTIRKVLSAVARDTTPPPGRPHPLRPQTIDDLKQCFLLITAREKEIIEAAGGEMNKRPRYADEPKTSQVVPFTKPKDKK